MSDVILLLPFAALLVVNFLPRAARARAWILAAAVFGLQTLAAVLLPFHLVDWTFLAPLEKAVGFSVRADNLAVLLLLTAGLAGLASVLVGRESLGQPRARFAFANLVLIALIGINGIAMVQDLFTLYVFIEVTSVAAFILVALRDQGAGLEGAWKYLLLSAVASVFMLASLALFLLTAGGRELRRGGGSPRGPHAPGVGRGGPVPLRTVREVRNGALPWLARRCLLRGAVGGVCIPGGYRHQGVGHLRLDKARSGRIVRPWTREDDPARGRRGHRGRRRLSLPHPD